MQLYEWKTRRRVKNAAQKTEQDKDGMRSLEVEVSWWGGETLVGWLESTWMQLRSKLLGAWLPWVNMDV
jgi:hypothetical protein